MTRLMAVVVGFMVDDQLSCVATGKDDASNKVTKLKCNCLLYESRNIYLLSGLFFILVRCY